MVLLISSTLSYRHCSGSSLCHQEVPGKMQAPSSSAAPAPSSISQGLHRKGGDVPQVSGWKGTSISYTCFPGGCSKLLRSGQASSRHLLAETRPGEKKEGKINRAARQSKPGRAWHCKQAAGLFGHWKAALVLQICYAVLGVSLVCKNSLGARTEANVVTVPLCKTEVTFSSGHQTVLLHQKIKWVVQKPFLTLRDLNCVSFFIPIPIVTCDAFLIYSVSEQELTELMLINSAGLGNWLPCGYPVFLWIITPSWDILQLRSKVPNVLDMKTSDSSNRSEKTHTKKYIPASPSCPAENWHSEHSPKHLS